MKNLIQNIKNFPRKRPVLAGITAFILIIILLTLIFLENILISIGSVLLKQEEPVDASYIVVLQGGIPDRIVHGADLYMDGYADTILMVESKSFTNYELIEELDLDLPSSVYINKEAALQLGVEEDDVKILPGKVDSTEEEAREIAKYLEDATLDEYTDESLDNELSEDDLTQKILLVTSEFHSNRARLIFEEGFSNAGIYDRVEVISTPSPYDPFEPDRWWQDRRQARNVLMEYLKFINFYTFGI
ncbi:YdcF family protein [Natranaerofaba carboxydovora]|uniref:YdcF family protein n=1 Tax=Natranaerofaba carboxydovora TaxID=2742683 RepID=UPI001F13CC72|nr:YdcF family protein [Natranaerofaba carboxydovora]UMZ74698.1 hypothetical protein ACONDI_02298 [Natranaerofaba carboxydovora]